MNTRHGNAMSQSYKLNYDAHARRQAPDDLHRQVRRTIDGKPVSGDQVELILLAIRDGLRLSRGDRILELACGNGVLSHHLFNTCSEYLGVDISPYLVDVARANFAIPPTHNFEVVDCIEYLNHEVRPERFTKALVYAGIQYFTDLEVVAILTTLHDRFRNLERVFVGNIPDNDQLYNFLSSFLSDSSPLESGPDTPIGVWRSKDEFLSLVRDSGWQIEFSVMPEKFYASHYRYDVTLTRGERAQ